MNLSDILDNNQGSIEVICWNEFRSKNGKDYIKHTIYCIVEIFGLYFLSEPIAKKNMMTNKAVLKLMPFYLLEDELNSNFILLSEFRDRRIDSILED